MALPVSTDLIDTHGHTVSDAIAQYPSDMAWGADIACTAAATGDLFTTVSGNHGLAAGDPVKLASKTGGTGLTVGATYYVIASGLTATAFKVATTAGGSAVDITVDASAAVVKPLANQASDHAFAGSGDMYIAQNAAEVAAQIG